jgi:hypothetical protein
MRLVLSTAAGALLAPARAIVIVCVLAPGVHVVNVAAPGTALGTRGTLRTYCVGTGLKPEHDDWRRVLTTSKGQVSTAPVVPPTLQEQGYNIQQIISNYQTSHQLKSVL